MSDTSDKDKPEIETYTLNQLIDWKNCIREAGKATERG